MTTRIDAMDLDFRTLNQTLRDFDGDVMIEHCLGQRFIAAGMGERHIRIHGVPGNALGAYLDGASIEVFGNAQDAVGDTMNAGMIVIHGNIGDTAGYAMRGGRIYVRGNAGYRTGIHMKAYQDKLPVLVIGGRTGSFLGEYQAGGIIVVLGLGGDEKASEEASIVSHFPCTGMHGGKLFLRSDGLGLSFPAQVTARVAKSEDMAEIEEYLREFCTLLCYDFQRVMDAPFTVVTPDNKNPYHQMYIPN